ncbi:hypothetical protein JAO76_04215 [Pontibacter sp. BT310]|uniref:HdeD family acid-resistance protein n=1 Tax=Pontibacter populi TaxID=890055 RepID=A0ABS6X9N6_9BACT|nr:MULTISPECIES: hypothetical protein [Pontibacter]MBJ6117380.1 hypothetical protein [Pontibacter sp. BT310]MBR0569805.1 hypothetical protein [Microvirga sp. STS03]MBW3364233.1 hypothetical protein [Pontibacter populi]
MNNIPLVNTDQLTKGSAEDLQQLQHAQQDMRNAYLNGFPGVVVSGTVWLASALVALYLSPTKAVWTLLVGGVFIHPVSMLFNKVLGAAGAHAQSNPLGKLGMEGTLFMIMCLPLAYGLSFQKVEWFFQGMLLIIGGRYLHFATIYGSRLYWALGIGLGISAYLLFSINSPSHATLLVGAAIEVLFGLVMLTILRRRKSSL